MRPFVLPVSVLCLAALLNACSPVVTSLQPDAVEKANKRFADLDKKLGPKRGENAELNRKLGQLYSDKPEYLALWTRDQSKERQPRVRTLVAPAAFGVDIRATVQVAFVVDEHGRVEDARILESSDSRFDKGALAAVRKWTFYPGSVGGTPVKFMLAVPLKFAGLRK